MRKRSTIGTNPLDVVIQNPLDATISDQHTGEKSSPHEDGIKKGRRASSAGKHLATTPVPHTKDGGAEKTPDFKGDGPKEKSQRHQGDIAQTLKPQLDGPPSSAEMAKRLSELERDNRYLKWACGLILAPLALLALLG